MMFHHACHVSFVRVADAEVPWHITLTEKRPPHAATIFGTCPSNLNFTYEDIQHNTSVVEYFPRPSNFRLFHKCLAEDIGTDFLDIYIHEMNVADYRYNIIGAVDPKSYVYLTSISQKKFKVLLLDSKPDDKTFAAVMRHQD